ncbi:MAG TPA: hypothetical protein VM368_02720 [Flavisolibacter sp.]|nr:hypothetical protein [Flavisolibacter sp.]
MIIIAHHHITDADAFWSAAREVTSSLPSHLKLHSVLPSADFKLGTCVWEAARVEDVQDFLDQNVGHASRNVCYEVNENAAMGLPQSVKEEALTD